MTLRLLTTLHLVHIFLTDARTFMIETPIAARCIPRQSLILRQDFLLTQGILQFERWWTYR